MCMQCAMGAVAAATATTGTRAWLVARFGHLLTPRRRKVITGTLIGAGVIASGLVGPTP